MGRDNKFNPYGSVSRRCFPKKEILAHEQKLLDLAFYERLIISEQEYRLATDTMDLINNAHLLLDDEEMDE